MDLANLQQKLIATARKHSPSDEVPYAFERRIMALLGNRPVMDRWGLWAAGLWRSAVACLAVAIVLGAFTLLAPQPPSASSNDLSQAFENTMLVAVDQDTDSAW